MTWGKNLKILQKPEVYRQGALSAQENKIKMEELKSHFAGLYTDFEYLSQRVDILTEKTKTELLEGKTAQITILQEVAQLRENFARMVRTHEEDKKGWKKNGGSGGSKFTQER